MTATRSSAKRRTRTAREVIEQLLELTVSSIGDVADLYAEQVLPLLRKL